MIARGQITIINVNDGMPGPTIWQAHAYKVFTDGGSLDYPSAYGSSSSPITATTINFGNGWSNLPKEGETKNVNNGSVWSPSTNSDYPSGSGWMESANNANDAFVRDRIHFVTLQDNVMFRVDIATTSTEQGYDGVMVGALDTDLSSISGALPTSRTTYNRANMVVTINTTVATAGVHFIDIVSRRDSSSGSVCAGYYRVVSSTNFAKSGYKIYSSVATIEDGIVQGSWSNPTPWQGSDGANGANGTNGTNGTNGEDGYTVTASPSAVIMQQATENADSQHNYGFTPIIVTFEITKGDNEVTGTNVVLNNISHLIVQTQHEDSNLSVNQIKVVRPALDNNNNLYDRGSFEVTVSAGNVTFIVEVPCCFNLVHEWMEWIEGDTKRVLAQARVFRLDSDTGEIIEGTYLYERVDTAENLIGNLTSRVDTQDTTISNLNTSVENAEQSVSEMQTEVNGVKTSVSSVVRESDRISQKVYQTNLFENSDLLPAADNTASHYAPTGWTVGSNYAILEKPYVGGSHLAYITYSGGNFYQEVWGSTAAKKKLVPGKWHTVTFYAKITGKMRVTFVGMATTSTWYIENYVYLNGVKTNLSNDSGNSARKYVEITPTDSNTYIKYDVQFFVKSTMTSRTSTGYINFTAPLSGYQVYLASPQLYEGMATGIDIANRKIDVIADNFNLWNNNGEKSMGVDEDGNAMFRGSLRYEYKVYFRSDLPSSNVPQDTDYYVCSQDQQEIYLPYAGDVAGKMMVLLNPNKKSTTDGLKLYARDANGGNREQMILLDDYGQQTAGTGYPIGFKKKMVVWAGTAANKWHILEQESHD